MFSQGNNVNFDIGVIKFKNSLKHHSVSFFIDDFDAFMEKVKKAKEEDDNS